MIFISDKSGKCCSCGNQARGTATIIQYDLSDGKKLKLCWNCSEMLYDMLEDKLDEQER